MRGSLPRPEERAEAGAARGPRSETGRVLNTLREALERAVAEREAALESAELERG